MYKIFIVEDDKGIADGIVGCLQNWGMEGVTVSNFRNVMEEFRNTEPHLILMDITLPFMGGFHWCQEIRKESSVPIIFISSRNTNMDQIMAMNMGADDFIAKPFDQSVLVAKISALLRRTYDFNQSNLILSVAGAVLNTNNNTLEFNGTVLELPRNEYRILLTLIS